ncbi:MAG: hypothetical protein ABW001_09085 [Mycobacterium sp.]
MPVGVWLVVAAMVVVAAVVLVAALAVGRRKRTARLKQRFGPEYERTISAAGARGVAERELADRERRREDLDIVALEPSAALRYAERWRGVQTTFVDDPFGALAEADGLVTEVLRTRGYPVDDFDQRADDVSVDHPTVVANYRAAHDVQLSSASADIGTEEQRQAFVHYRALFDELLESQTHDNPSRDAGTAQEATA